MQEHITHPEQAQVKTERMTPFARAKYCAGSAAAAGGVAAVLGFGSGSLVLAAAGGIAGAVFSPEIRGVLVDHLPAPREATNRRSKLAWLLTGETPEEEPEDEVLDADNRLMELRAMPYADYLQTPEWQATRAHIFARDAHACRDCGAQHWLEVHHLTYERLGCEQDADLLTLCRECHQKRHPDKSAQGDAMDALQPRRGDAQLLPPSHGSLRAPSSSSFFTFSDVLRKGFVPSLEKIYLATLEDGADVFASSTQLCHVALAGATRGGKGHIKRSLMAQLAYAGAEIYLLDPKYTRWDLESVDPTGRPCPEDWTPYDRFLQNDPTELIPVRKKYQVIGTYLQAANVELDRRLERYGNSKPVGRPIFLFLDELPDIVDNIPDVQTVLKRILRLGAGVGMNVVCLSQDFLVKTLFPQSGGGAVRDCYRTVLYVGGDATTANVLLDMPAREVPENELGKGRVMIRCDVVRPAAKAKSPYVDNAALYHLLGPSTYTQPAEEDEDQVAAYLVSPLQPRETPQPRPYRVQKMPERAPEPRVAPVARSKAHKVYAVEGSPYARKQARLDGLRAMPVSEQGDRRIPALQEVKDTFLDQKPSKRDIQRRFRLTDYQAYELYKQLNPKAVG